MYKRQISDLGIETSLLGYGCMRFPTKDGHIDEEEAERLLDRAYAAGINYFDTAYPYHDGQSEPLVGRVLAKYPRDSYFLATKLPCWKVNSLEDARQVFAEQLGPDRLNRDYVDFYLLHALNRERFNVMRDLGVIDWLAEQKAAGRIRYLGFSFHDGFDAFKDILEYRQWDFCQIQLNYMDVDEQAGMDGYALAESMGVPLVIMEPVKGGSLASLPDDIMRIFHRIDPSASAASWALRFIGSLPNVKVVLSGMTHMDQLEDNLETFEDFRELDDEEKEAVDQAAKALRKRVFNGCTGCRYCMPCPAGVAIPYNFRIWNEYGMYRNADHTKWVWANNIKDEDKAKNCLKCGQCEEACPQHINIRENLAELQKMLDELQ